VEPAGSGEDLLFQGEGYQNPPTTSEHTLTTIKFRDYQKHGQNEFAFYKEMCMHCNDPACASVCRSARLSKPRKARWYIIGALHRLPFCMIACPFGIPKYEWSKALPLVKKCTGCYSRVKEGMKPACAKACPSAISYGSRDEMVEKARQRLAAKPDRYVNRIYGLDEAGGTSVLYLSPCRSMSSDSKK